MSEVEFNKNISGLEVVLKYKKKKFINCSRALFELSREEALFFKQFNES